MRVHFVYFYTEGILKDGVPTLDLTESVKLLREKLKNCNYDEIHEYSYQRVQEMNPKVVEYVHNLGPYCGSTHGFYRWKPYIIMDVLNKIDEGDILLYTDSNVKRYEKYLVGFNKYRDLAVKVLDNNKIDFFASTENTTISLAHCCKKEAFDFVGLDFNKFKDTLLINARLIICRNTKQTRDLIQKWFNLCMTDDLIRKDVYGIKQDSLFLHHTEDQALLNLVIRKEQLDGNLPMNVGLICFPERLFTEENLTWINTTKVDSGFHFENFNRNFSRWQNPNMNVDYSDGTYCLQILHDESRPWRWIGRKFSRGDFIIEFDIKFEFDNQFEDCVNVGWKLHQPYERFYRKFLSETRVGEWKKVQFAFHARDELGILIFDGLKNKQRIWLKNLFISKMAPESLFFGSNLQLIPGTDFLGGCLTRYDSLEKCFIMQIDEKRDLQKLTFPIHLRGTYRFSFDIYTTNELPTIEQKWGFKTLTPVRFINEWAVDLTLNQWNHIEFQIEIPEDNETVMLNFNHTITNGIIKIRDFQAKRLC